jgi:hypothetical protein
VDVNLSYWKFDLEKEFVCSISSYVNLGIHAETNSSENKDHSQPCICVMSATILETRSGVVIGVEPFDITFPSAHHSPSTVNKNAREFVIGTVRLSSTINVIT